jgi:hypothetical protein
MTGKKFELSICAAAFLAVLATGAAPAKSSRAPAPPSADAKAPDPYAGLPYRFIGPPGNRVSAVVGVPRSNTRRRRGGVPGSTDGGIEGARADGQSARLIARLFDPNVVRVGTKRSSGDTCLSATASQVHRLQDKDGMETGRMSRPRGNPLAFRAALGTCYGPQAEWASTADGQSWERPFVAVDTGGVGLNATRASSWASGRSTQTGRKAARQRRVPVAGRSTWASGGRPARAALGKIAVARSTTPAL